MKILNVEYVPADKGGRAEPYYNVGMSGMQKGKFIEGHNEYWVVVMDSTCPECQTVFQVKGTTEKKDSWLQWEDQLCKKCLLRKREKDKLAMEKAQAEQEKGKLSDEDGDALMNAIFGKID